MPRRLAPLLLMVMIAAPALADDKDKPKGDLEKLRGKWTAKAGPNKDYTVAMEINGHQVISTITAPDSQVYKLRGELKLDEEAKPKQIDWIKFAKPDGSGDYDPNLAIYELDGDTLKVCQGGPGRPRPVEFKAGEDGGPRLLEFTRVKGDKKDADKPKDEQPKDDKPKGDLGKLQGTWEGLTGPEGNVPIVMTLKGDAISITIAREEGEIALKGQIKLDEQAKPKALDITGIAGPDNREIPDILSIYELDGDTFKTCGAGPGRPRPTEFKADPDIRQRLTTFKRKKTDK